MWKFAVLSEFLGIKQPWLKSTMRNWTISILKKLKLMEYVANLSVSLCNNKPTKQFLVDKFAVRLRWTIGSLVRCECDYCHWISDIYWQDYGHGICYIPTNCTPLKRNLITVNFEEHDTSLWSYFWVHARHC